MVQSTLIFFALSVALNVTNTYNDIVLMGDDLCSSAGVINQIEYNSTHNQWIVLIFFNNFN